MRHIRLIPVHLGSVPLRELAGIDGHERDDGVRKNRRSAPLHSPDLGRRTGWIRVRVARQLHPTSAPRPRRRSSTPTCLDHLAVAAARAGGRHPGLRLLHRRHRRAAATVCAVRHRTRQPTGALGRCHGPPDGPWVVQQPRNLLLDLGDRGAVFRFLIRDRDTKFTRAFDDVWRSSGAEIICTPIRAPNANAVAERWVGTVRRACLDHLLIVGRQHLVHVLRGLCRALQPAPPAPQPRPGHAHTVGVW